MSSLLPFFVGELGYALFEPKGKNEFLALTEAPAWLLDLWGPMPTPPVAINLAEKSPYLENFLDEAHAFWTSGGSGECRSETWVESNTTGREVPLQAIALHVQGKPLLALHNPDLAFRDQVRTLQTARNALLDHERLLGEIQKKEILLHCIIHDLSQPLSVMHVALDCLTDEVMDAKHKKFVELGKNASEQQESMIREVLQIFSADLRATLDAEKGDAEKEDAEKSGASSPNLRKSADAVVTSLGPAFEAKQVRITLTASQTADEDWLVRGEESRLRRIFSNLLENALRYSPAGSRVTITLENDGEFCQTNVDDEGPGLPPDLRPSQIFGLFSKGKQGSGKAGLGMYFCRITVERWGGSIGCASLPEKGARFWFRLPRASVAVVEHDKQAALQSTTPAAPPQIPHQEGPLRILLAEDQDEIRMLTTHQLERNGHSVVAVSNGQEALDKARDIPFDVILLDEQMPIVGGVEVARKIHHDSGEDSKRPYLVALTGNNTDEDHQRLRSEGFDFVLGKPFRLSALNDLFQRSTVPSQPNEPSAQIQKDTKHFAGLPALLERVGGDEKLLHQMIRTFLKDTPKRMAALQQQIRRKNSPEVTALAHAILGSSAIFGASEASKFAKQIQALGRDAAFSQARQVYELLKEEIANLERNLRGYVGHNRPSGSGTPRKARRVAPKRSR
jgi:signal transduction histidine kinase/HPt (histidine-containing phosphotransfer) domain-containing protein